MKKEGLWPSFFIAQIETFFDRWEKLKIVLFILAVFVYNENGYVYADPQDRVDIEGEAHMAEEEKNQPIEKEEKMTWQKSCMLYLHDLIYMLAAIMIAFMLLFRVVIVSGSSMYSTLWDGDWLLVLSSVFYNDPEYGDIIIASKDSFDNGEPIVKRVIATEGQTVDIDFDAGIVYVDGVALEEDYIYTSTTVYEGMNFPLVVEEGCVFVMGDNRKDSKDSRSPEIGLVDEREILGKAIFLMFPGTDKGNAERNFDRIGALS